MKLDDIPFIVRDMQNEMPVHTPTTVHIPHSFVRGLPKNLMDRSAEVDNKFLNTHLHEILEFYHCFPEYHSKSFEGYQLATYSKKYDILNHDGFFNSQEIKDWIEQNKKPMVQGASQKILYFNQGNRAAGGGGCTAGTELETVGTDNSGFSSSTILIGSAVTADTSKCYDRATGKYSTATGEVNIGVYDDSSGDPDNLEGSTGAVTNNTNYDYTTDSRDITEWTPATAKQWICANPENSDTLRRQTSGAGKFRSYSDHTSLPDPFGSASDSSNTYRFKMTHS